MPFSSSLVDHRRTNRLQNRKAYIRELEQYGKVKTVLQDGTVAEVEINTPAGPKVIETLELTVIIVGLLSQLINIVVDVYLNVRDKLKKK
jgi:hypothetical protein